MRISGYIHACRAWDLYVEELISLLLGSRLLQHHNLMTFRDNSMFTTYYNSTRQKLTPRVEKTAENIQKLVFLQTWLPSLSKWLDPALMGRRIFDSYVYGFASSLKRGIRHRIGEADSANCNLKLSTFWALASVQRYSKTYEIKHVPSCKRRYGSDPEGELIRTDISEASSASIWLKPSSLEILISWR